MRILLVEDDPVSAMAVSAMARSLGHAVTVAPDGTSALELLNTSDVDIVLGDWYLPDLSGPELCRRIQARTERFVPFLYVSGQSDRARQLEGMRAGAIGYVDKPVSPHDLAIQLLGAERVLALHRELEDQRRQLRQQVDRLRVEARRDHTTGLANRASFEEDVVEVHAQARARGVRYALAMIDLDRFKDYNDALGHPAGDAALRRVSGILASAVRSTDRIYRYGGEELVMLLPTPDPETALRVVDRLRHRVWAARLPHPTGKDGVMTFSGGVAVFDPARPAPWGRLLEEADRALYQAKLSGRDRVVLAEPCPVEVQPTTDLRTCQAIRRAVFVEEQRIDPAIEADGRDGEALHMLATCAGEPAGTARLRLLDGYAKAERVAVLGTFRGRGVGEALMAGLERLAQAHGAPVLRLHAQESVIPFYRKLGYVDDGPPFVEASIPHLPMRKELSDP